MVVNWLIQQLRSMDCEFDAREGMEKDIASVLRDGLKEVFQPNLASMMRQHGALVVEQKEYLLECVQEIIQVMGKAKGKELQDLSFMIVATIENACENILNQLSVLPMFHEVFDWGVFVGSIIRGSLLEEDDLAAGMNDSEDEEEEEGSFVSTTTRQMSTFGDSVMSNT